MVEKGFFEEGLALLIRMNSKNLEYINLSNGEQRLLRHVYANWGKELLEEAFIHRKMNYVLSEKGKSYVNQVTTDASQNLDHLL